MHGRNCERIAPSSPSQRIPRFLPSIILSFHQFLDLNDPLYTATVVFKCFGKDFSPFQVNAVANIFKELASYNMICLENLHKDGRSTVIHLLDACFRANVLKDSYSQDQFEVFELVEFK